MSCNYCGTNMCQCGSVPQHGSCCNTKTICPDSIVTVNQGDVTLSGGAGPVLTLERSFSIPACDDQAKVSVYGEVAAPPAGSQIFVTKDSKVAYLTVISTTRYYENSSQSSCSSSCGSSSESDTAYRTEITVSNPCLSCTTLDSGTFIEQGESALITAPECTGSATGTSDLVLCDKLHIPAVGSTEEVVVSPSTSSLAIGDILQITDKKYQVESVPSSTVVELKNIGEGGDEGSIIDGSDCQSVRIFLIAGDNPCEKTPVAEADAVRVCDGSNDTVLELEDDEFVGQVDGKVVGVKINQASIVESDFSGCINLNPSADPQEYPISVDEPDKFEVGNVVYFSCDEDERTFKVIAKDSSVITLEPETDPTLFESLGCDDCTLVQQDCCTQLDSRLTIVESEVECMQELMVPSYQAWEFAICPTIDTAFQAGQNVSFDAQILDAGVFEAAIVNSFQCEARAHVSFQIAEFHKNLEQSDGTDRDGTWSARYAWNVINNDTAEVYSKLGFTIKPSEQDITTDFPEAGIGDWLSAGEGSLFDVMTAETTDIITMDADSTLNLRLRQLFAYRRNNAVNLVEFQDLMCYHVRVNVVVLPNELCCL